ncbi:MAG: hypothetical protein ACXADY_18565 [Candidatus Hodarchaeales archaeon]|jgi:hypothetical protein
MNPNQKTEHKRFYLTTVDILQGLSILLMVGGHTFFWWDEFIESKWPNMPFAPWIFLAIAQLAHPCFYFLYGFNLVNSLLRKEKSERSETRNQLLKRTIIFLLIAEVTEASTALVNSPQYLLNFLLTWQLFHLFALTTIFLLLIFEFAWKIETQDFWNHRRVVTTVLSIFLVLVISFFLFFHDYSNNMPFQVHYVNLDFSSILQAIFFEDGQNPVIPWLSFSIIGGLLASFLDLPHEQKNEILKKAGVASTGGLLIFIVGVLFLEKERYISTPMLFPASSSFVLIGLGAFVFSTTIMILFIDLNSLYSNKSINKFFYPFVLVSNISLTVYIVHNVAWIIPAQSPLIRLFIPSETAVLVIGILYSLFFILVAYIWQKWKFKFSLEWMILHLQRAQWRWWRRKPPEITV